MGEFYPGVRFYGHGNILRKYSGFPYWLPLPICIQHGWMVRPILHDARADAAENWYWSQNIAGKFKEQYSFVKYRISGSPFLYCLKNSNCQIGSNRLREGTIVFPFHSTEEISLHTELEEYCRMLNDLPAEYKPITICVYHNDKKNGADSVFLKNGFNTVCNSDDPCSDDFLYNFIRNVKDKKYLISNEWSTAIHYGAIMKCKVHLYGPEVNIIKSNDKNFSDRSREDINLFNRENRIYYSFPQCDQQKQYEIAALELGVRHMFSRMKMNLLLWRLVCTRKYLEKILTTIIRKSASCDL